MEQKENKMEQLIVGKTVWLRNDYPTPIKVGTIVYPSVEHAFQAAKYTDDNTKRRIANSDVRTARKLGHRAVISDDWHLYQLDVMEALLAVKFSCPQLKSLLINSDEAEIVYEDDVFWGQDSNGYGADHLPQMLMALRQKLQFIEGYTFLADHESTLEEVLVSSDTVDRDNVAGLCQKLLEQVKEFLSLDDSEDDNVSYPVLCKLQEIVDLIDEAVYAYDQHQVEENDDTAGDDGCCGGCCGCDCDSDYDS